ncbi:hypothetical protein CEUSTIGMA_g11457.t1 [Chlamydomonas eustigma]|uniref:Selenoprotein F/M domain-containing protein n=1 Tax=Chlamydomonas eustigma TaxID=1157962 RepID=A0A250XLX5_9CHLO|nr:hypothetical protein CEUSTIGMA_g11457.t1 [Chlamydomonas eustigma]|eukprot:GAX84033.1 hypothetical protein CEUSTIGMA_g11457.t1 [Chlamydomonas eustigma]
MPWMTLESPARVEAVPERGVTVEYIAGWAPHLFMYDENAKEIHRMELHNMQYSEIEALVNSKGFYRASDQLDGEESDEEDALEYEDTEEEMLFYEDGAAEEESYERLSNFHEEL